MTPKDDFASYSGKHMGIVNFGERLLEQDKRTEQKIQRTADEILSDYRKQKNQPEDNAKESFKFLCSSEDFKQIVADREKNSNIQEEHLGNYLLLCPCIFFEYQYLKKVSLKGPKKPLKGSTVLSLYESDQSWRPELCKEVNENNLIDVTDGNLVEFTKERAEEHIAMLLSVAINDTSNRFSSWRKKLNINTSPKDIQTLLRVEVIYLPFWIAKFQTAKGIDYLVCDRLGNKREAMSKTITPDILFETV